MGNGNLIDLRDRTPEERRAIQSKGGKAKAEKERQRKAIGRTMLEIIDAEADRALARKALAVVAPGLTEGATNGTVMASQQAKKAIQGDTRAFEAVRAIEAEERARLSRESRDWCFDYSRVLGRDFTDIHRLMWAGLVRDVWAPGGRGSLKSSWAALEVVGLLMDDPDGNAVVVQANAVNLEQSTYAKVRWAMEQLGVADLWNGTKKPMQFRNVETDQLIIFRGCDNPDSFKSIAWVRGYTKVMWVEETDLLRGMAELRKIRQSVTRGNGDVPCIRLYTFNPPRSADNWANKECDRVRCSSSYSERVVDSCYTDAPPEWLGRDFIEDAEALAEIDPTAYEHEYLGKAVGFGGEVFANAEYLPITDGQIASFDRICCGQDFGWWPDPWALTVSAWEPGTRTLYTFAERGGNKLQPEEMAEQAMDALTWRDDGSPEPRGHRCTVWSDDADPGRIEAMRDFGVDAQKSGKGGKRMQSYEWLAGVRWVIDPLRCPNLAEEARAMHYERAGDDTYLNAIPDGNDHWIDATRYAVMHIVRNRGAYGTDRERPRHESAIRRAGRGRP